MTNNTLVLINVVYENYTVLPDFLESLRNQSNKNFYLINIDLSVHRSIIDLKKIPGETIYSMNKGYAHGVNVGLKKAIDEGFHFFCIINNDTYFKQDFIKNSLISLINHPLSIIGGKIYYAPGYEYHKGRYKKSNLGKVIWYAGGFVDWKHAFTPHIGVDKVDNGQFNIFKEVNFINGALMLFNKSVIDKVGFWDEGYFLYFEDADFCIRAKKVGIKLFYDPSIVIWHKISQSTGGSGSSLHQKYQNKNRLKFGLKYAPLRTKLHLIKNYIFDLLSFRT
ncbi:hypothetical protein A2954_07090 [Candidatus Roizmanbacteria bacterium RIFCSPLOWO2_01_FULL_37_12]|uniref:Glycosyltransferase 2-like domain-containing protein n=1 Tax=Candidatus Roizmanbacteria bacterium RIFCSPLOWO2_01_FULL_37_12 TaxID=1802056 RepID=A0A1F7IE32_9BACT|nr:MAG: hypothetical protein A3D76_02395 [Candidatus Roizmanbacteria bacterium RIFCSPHIGHO2_02_FULL_37_9b]OGK41617.1 MAG: hypothetical protein A2954_07090 [Candidatus Roizmanbacteria bacterium RIFCSPLOWO2_01_FULL_37_12]